MDAIYGACHPRRTYLLVYLALTVAATLAAEYAPPLRGGWGIAVALLIAAAKALLIALYFMHVRHSGHLVRIASAGPLSGWRSCSCSPSTTT